MKSIACATMVALLAICLALPSLVLAGADGPSATGSFQFQLEDGATRFLEFNARQQNNGRTVGEMTFSDPAVVPIGDPDSQGSGNPGALIRAKFDCLKITGNKAVMSGEIFESNVLSAIGLRVLLVVEDNGEGINVPTTDKLTWGIYQTSGAGWTPKDAERDDDNGASLNWLATDSERAEDPGVPSKQSKVIGCQSFSLEAYTLVNIAHGGGNVQVQP